MKDSKRVLCTVCCQQLCGLRTHCPPNLFPIEITAIPFTASRCKKYKTICIKLTKEHLIQEFVLRMGGDRNLVHGIVAPLIFIESWSSFNGNGGGFRRGSFCKVSEFTPCGIMSGTFTPKPMLQGSCQTTFHCLRMSGTFTPKPMLQGSCQTTFHCLRAACLMAFLGLILFSAFCNSILTRCFFTFFQLTLVTQWSCE